MFRNRSLGEFVLVQTSEMKKYRGGDGLVWRQTDYAIKDLVRNDYTRLIKMEIWNRKSKGKKEEFIGQAEFPLSDCIRENLGKDLFVYHKKNLIGRIESSVAEEFHKYQFIDYIHGGMTISLFVAIDFSLGNKDPKNPYSYHYMNENNIENEDDSDSGDAKKKKKIAAMMRKKAMMTTMSQVQADIHEAAYQKDKAF